jgi:hypothetical protein
MIVTNTIKNESESGANCDTYLILSNPVFIKDCCSRSETGVCALEWPDS